MIPIYPTVNVLFSQLVHMDIILELGAAKQVIFFGEEKVSNENRGVKEYTVKEDISSAVLVKVVHYAYLEKCQLEGEPASLVIALSKTAFKYGLNSLLKYCIAHMMKNCSPPIAYFAYELAMTCNSSSNIKGSNNALSSLVSIDSTAAQAFFQKFIEDHFEEVSKEVFYCLVMDSSNLHHHHSTDVQQSPERGPPAPELSTAEHRSPLEQAERPF